MGKIQHVLMFLAGDVAVFILSWAPRLQKESGAAALAACVDGLHGNRALLTQYLWSSHGSYEFVAYSIKARGGSDGLPRAQEE